MLLAERFSGADAGRHLHRLVFVETRARAPADSRSLVCLDDAPSDASVHRALRSAGPAHRLWSESPVPAGACWVVQAASAAATDAGDGDSG